MTWWMFLLALGAVARLTRFLNSDVLAEPIRLRVEDKYGYDSLPAYLLSCPWCASIWIAPPVLACAATGGWFTWPAAALSISYLYGLAATHLDPDE